MSEYQYVPLQYGAGRFRAIRANYRTFADEVLRGEESWMDHNDVYALADWGRLMTPIESAIWQDIRQLGIALWPQLPVGRYFVDFGNPVKRIAVECDGAAWHDPVRDAARDKDLAKQGWTVYRVSGRDCLRESGSKVMREIAARFASRFS